MMADQVNQWRKTWAKQCQQVTQSPLQAEMSCLHGICIWSDSKTEHPEGTLQRMSYSDRTTVYNSSQWSSNKWFHLTWHRLSKYYKRACFCTIPIGSASWSNMFEHLQAAVSSWMYRCNEEALCNRDNQAFKFLSSVGWNFLPPSSTLKS